jgi:hypothetical protein
MTWSHSQEDPLCNVLEGVVPVVYISSYKYDIDMITTFQNLKLNLNGTEAMTRKVANNAHEAASRGGRTITSPLTPLHARLNASTWKPTQVV